MSITEESKKVTEGYRVVGEGLTVYDDPEPVEGTVIWLDSPRAHRRVTSASSRASSASRA
jgi:hypothetical protein